MSDPNSPEFTPKRYYFGMRDGYDTGDTITIGVRYYEIITIDEANQTMLIEEILKNEENKKD